MQGVQTITNFFGDYYILTRFVFISSSSDSKSSENDGRFVESMVISSMTSSYRSCEQKNDSV